MLLLLETACNQQTVNQPTQITPPLPAASATPVSFLHLPPGFQATAFARDLHGPRLITFSPNGTLIVAERGTGHILALPDPEHNGQTTGPVVVASGLNDSTSVAFAPDGSLYVGEASRVTRFTLGPDMKSTSMQIIVPHLPTGGNHITRTVLIGPDKRLYVSIGSTCNDCVETDPMRATVWVYNSDGSGGKLFARGLRNAVGLATNPWNQHIWATDNGRDLLGDNIPARNRLCPARWRQLWLAGLPRGHDHRPRPWEAGRLQRHRAAARQDAGALGPAGSGVYKASAFPAGYRGLFVAFHGSWNRTVPTGYKVIFIPLNAQGTVAGAPQDFSSPARTRCWGARSGWPWGQMARSMSAMTRAASSIASRIPANHSKKRVILQQPG